MNKGGSWYWDDFVGPNGAQHMDDLQAWGINFVRCVWRRGARVVVVFVCGECIAAIIDGSLGYMWSGVEPAPNQFNMTYLNVTQWIVDELASRGIYTMFDMHGERGRACVCVCVCRRHRHMLSPWCIGAA